MAKKTSQTFAKRQRENARREKQLRKAAKRLERRQQAAERTLEPGESVVPIMPLEDEALVPVEDSVETELVD